MSYDAQIGGLPPQTAMHTGRAVFTEAYAVLPRGTFSDIVTMLLPGWEGAKIWIIARPMSGFSETFSHCLIELQPGGGSDAPEHEPGAQGAIFVSHGTVRITIAGHSHDLTPGGFAWMPPDCEWSLRATGDTPARLHWIRKIWVPAPGLTPPAAFVGNDHDNAPNVMADTEGRWATTRFMDHANPAFDMHITIVTVKPGGLIPFEETHVMEHGLYVLQGKGVYRLNRDWVEVEAGDYMWLRAFCPQACYAGGPEPFRYLLYKDVNRLPRLHGPFSFAR